jgi:hypothetical protein
VGAAASRESGVKLVALEDEHRPGLAERANPSPFGAGGDCADALRPLPSDSLFRTGGAGGPYWARRSGRSRRAYIARLLPWALRGRLALAVQWLRQDGLRQDIDS